MQLNEELCINKISGKLQHKVWILGKKKEKIVGQQQHEITTELLQVKVWDPKELHQLMKAHD